MFVVSSLLNFAYCKKYDDYKTFWLFDTVREGLLAKIYRLNTSESCKRCQYDVKNKKHVIFIKRLMFRTVTVKPKRYIRFEYEICRIH